MSINIVILFMLLTAAFAIYMVNVSYTLTNLRKAYLQQFTAIEKLLYRRHELIRSVICVTRVYLPEEAVTLQNILRVQQQASQTVYSLSDTPAISSLDELIDAEKRLDDKFVKLYQLISITDSLKNNHNIKWLLNELNTIQEHLIKIHPVFNNAVLEYNQYRHSFPSFVFAAYLGHGLNCATLNINSWLKA